MVLDCGWVDECVWYSFTQVEDPWQDGSVIPLDDIRTAVPRGESR